MKKHKVSKKQLISVALLACTASVQVLKAGYKEPNSYKYPRTTITLGQDDPKTGETDPKYDPESSWNDTRILNNAIKEVAKKGGRVIIPAGDYIVQGAHLLSNVHIVVHKNATIKTTNNGGSIFGEPKDSSPTDTSIRGAGGSFTAQLRGDINSGTKLLHAFTFNNFKLENVNLENNNPVKSQSIALGWHEDGKSGRHSPQNLKIKNVVKNTRSHYGYGLMQVQACRDSNFDSMKAKGGVPIRLETGLVPMQQRGKTTGGVHNISIINCVSTEAQSTVKINPHTMQNGNIYANKCKGTASVNVVAFEAGNNHANLSNVPDEGSFGKVTIKNTTGTYRPTGAPYKSGSFVHLPVNFVKAHPTHGKFYKVPSNSRARTYRNDYIGPSANVVHNSGKARNGLTITGVFRSVASQYGNVPEFRKTATGLSAIKGWMIRDIPTKNTPAGW